MKKKCIVAFVFLFFLTGCTVQKDDMEKVRELQFTVLEERNIPEELAEYIEEAKTEPFEMVYGDEGYLYIAKGYGTKETSGYSIEVEECYESTNVICVRTDLLGPENDDEIAGQETYPYIVLKTEYSEKNVVFK